MKRLLAALFLALVVALVVASGVASADPPNDFTTGGGKIESTAGVATIEEKFGFSAHDEDNSPSTSAARNGHYVYQRTVTTPSGTSEFDLKGSVDCVVVSGTQAFFSGPIKKSSNPNLEGFNAAFFVVDNDPPPLNGADPDQFRLAGFSPVPRLCTLDLPTAGNFITSGNILVSDAP